MGVPAAYCFRGGAGAAELGPHTGTWMPSGATVPAWLPPTAYRLLSAQVPVEEQRNERQDADTDQNVVLVEHAAHFTPVLPELVAGIGQRQAPRQGTQERVGDELAEVHARNARGQRDEGAHDRH